MSELIAGRNLYRVFYKIEKIESQRLVVANDLAEVEVLVMDSYKAELIRVDVIEHDISMAILPE